MGIILSTEDTGSIIEKLYPDCDPDILPTEWNEHDKHSGITLSDDGLTARHYDGLGRCTEERSIRANRKIPSECEFFYFEVQILKQQKEYSGTAVGLMSNKTLLDVIPGLDPGSIAYYMDGSIYSNIPDDETDYNEYTRDEYNDIHVEAYPYGEPFKVGDIIGCGIDKKIGQVFFTRNAKYLGSAFQNCLSDPRTNENEEDIKKLIKSSNIFPAIGMDRDSDEVSVNFGKTDFKFDILEYVKIVNDTGKGPSKNIKLAVQAKTSEINKEDSRRSSQSSSDSSSSESESSSTVHAGYIYSEGETEYSTSYSSYNDY